MTSLLDLYAESSRLSSDYHSKRDRERRREKKAELGLGRNTEVPNKISRTFAGILRETSSDSTRLFKIEMYFFVTVRYKQASKVSIKTYYYARDQGLRNPTRSGKASGNSVSIRMAFMALELSNSVKMLAAMCDAD